MTPKERWLAALASGKYKEGTKVGGSYYLCINNTYSPLGVAYELYCWEHLWEVKTRVVDGFDGIFKTYDGYYGRPSKELLAWLGIDNDFYGWTFEQVLNYFKKPFGYSYLLDMHRCKGTDDLEITYRFLEELVDLLGMTRCSQPVVFHGPRGAGRELFPEKAGISGWVPLIESGIQIHTLNETNFITLDVYSCKLFEAQVVLDFAKKTYGFERSKEHWIERF